MRNQVIPAHLGSIADVRRLYVVFSGQLERIVRAGVRASDAVIEDACQAAWVKLIRHGDQVTQQSAPGWLVSTAIHEAFRLTWRETREYSLDLLVEESPQLLPPALNPGPEEVVLNRERIRAVQTLSVRLQRLLWLRALGLSYDEVAAREGCTNHTVDRQLTRARNRLRALERGKGEAISPDPACAACARPD